MKNCIFYTDGWEAFAKVLPKRRHIIGKSHTHIVESNNSDTRHHLGRFTRKTKIVSKSENAVDFSLKLCNALTLPDVFLQFQQLAFSTYV